MTSRLIKYLFRSIIFLILVSYFLVAGVLLVTKYWFMPRIDSWRPDIESSLSEALGSKVVLDRIKADWNGFSPSFELDGLTIHDSQNDEAVVVPKINAIFAWRSLLALEPQFRYIGIEGLALAIQRSEDGVIHVAGFEIDPGAETDQTDQAAQTTTSEQVWFRQEPVRWLLAQTRLDINDAIIIWIDQERGAPPLEVSDFNLSLRNSLLSHRLSAEFALPASQGQRVELSMTSDRLGAPLQVLGDDKIDGELYLALSDMDPASLKTWIDLPEVSGRYSARSWLGLEQGRLANVTLELAAADAAMHQTETQTTSWSADRLNLRIDGPLGMVLPVAQHAEYVSEVGSSNPISLQFDGRDMMIGPPADVMAPLQFDSFAALTRLRYGPKGDLNLLIEDINARTPDGSLTLKGRWSKSRESETGDLDVQGALTELDLSRLYHYLPADVGQDVIDWMQRAFTAGSIPRAAFVVRGPVAEFPFEGASKGVFTLDGAVQNWTIDYAPAESPDEKGWPALVGLKGSLSLNRDVLSATTHAGGLDVGSDTRIGLTRLDATISDLFSNPSLKVNARTQSPAQGYQKALTDTALADLLPGAVADLRGTGDWSLNLDLTMPLDDVEDVTFQTALDLHGGSLQFAQTPALESVTGQAVFSGDGFRSEGLHAKLLGSDVQVSGSFGQPDSVLTVRAGLAMQALNDYLKMPSLNQYIRGTLPVEMTVTQPVVDGPVKIGLDSSMEGVQLLFPAPLSLASGTALKTRLDWEIDPNSASVGSGTLRMGNLIQVNATGRRSGQGSALSSVAIGIGAAPGAPADGLTVNIAANTLDATAWQGVQDNLMKDLDVSSSGSEAFMPALASVQLATEQVKWDDRLLDKVQATMRVTEDRYAVNFSSTQTSGTLNWQMNNGAFVGRLQARLARLELGADSPEEATRKAAAAKSEVAKPILPDENTLSTIPPVDVVIDDLVLHGMKLGRLELVGENASGNRHWNIEKMTLTGPAASLEATGQWRFVQDNPGMNADLTLNVRDLGEFLAALGHPDQIRRGKGTIKAQIDWQNFPWFLGFEGMQGKAQVDLSEGIFDHVNSQSARVLELLSLQSFSRILDLNVNRGETFEKGFPWSSIRGNLDINRGEINTKDLTIDSPVATIAFDGGTNLVSETFNIRATVRPNLDMSGTAMATGFLLNPVIGLGALVGNYILKNPLESALSLRYEVTGPWLQPQLKEVGATPEPLPESVRAQQATIRGETPPAEGAAGSAQPTAEQSNSGQTAGESGSQPPAEPDREVYRIELGKDSGFDPDAKNGAQGQSREQQQPQPVPDPPSTP